MDIKKKYISINDNELFNGMWDIYEKSFPETELRKISNLRSVMQNGHCKVIVHYTQEGVVGFIIFWEYADFIYLEFFATNPDMRNGGYGAHILRDFIAEHQKPLILEIDGMVDEISNRRCGFYKREGFILNHYNHRPTAYNDKNVHLDMHIMTYKQAISQEQYDKFNEILTNDIMSNLYE